jgi:AcrR family transcriptional regulator
VHVFLVRCFLVTVELMPSRRERKKLATRQAIHDAAFELAESRGIGSVTVEAIAEQADVAPRTFWSYFPSKEHAVMDQYPGRPEEIRQALINRPPGEDPLTALRRVMEEEGTLRAVGTDRHLRLVRLIRGEPQLRAAMAAASGEIERALVEGIAERTACDPDRDLYPRILVGATWGAFKAAHLYWVEQGGRGPLDELIASVFDSLQVSPIGAGRQGAGR